PGAAGAIETAVLIGLEQGTNVLQCVVATEPVPGNAAQRTPASGSAGIGLITGGRLEAVVTGHAMPRELRDGGEAEGSFNLRSRTITDRDAAQDGRWEAPIL